MGRFSTNFRTEALAGRTPIAVLEFTVGSTTIRVSDGPLVSNTRGLYNPYIVSWGGAVSHEAYEHDGGLTSPTLSATIRDPDDVLMALFTGEDALNVVGGAAAGYLLYKDPDLVFADWFQFFAGLINEFSYVERRVWRMGFRFDDFAIAAETGDLFVQSITANEFATLQFVAPPSQVASNLLPVNV